ncbi:MAG: LCP family protein [Actinomycetota bacterium]|nr:LCP family protein [Actinomycetota bacterium]
MTSLSSRAGRRVEQRRQRRRKQVRLIGALLGVLALLAGGFAVYLAAADPPAPPPAPPATVGRTQTTLLLQVAGADGVGIANALLGHDPGRQAGAVLLLPPQVLVNVPGSGPAALGALAALPADTSRAALSDLAGVVVDNSWTLTAPALAALVNTFGGVSVEVDAPVVDGPTVLIPPGVQRLDGARAVALLGFLAPGEQEQARLARVQDVLDALLDVLPGTPAELAPVLQGLGEGSVSSLAPQGLAAFLLGLAEDDENAQLQYDVLPVVPIDPGEGVTAFRVDADRTRALIGRLFADSVPPGVGEPGNRVLVLNGVGTPGLGEVVRGKLVPAGFVFVGSRNAPSFGVATTQILVPAATAEAQALGQRVAAAIGVPPTSVATQEFGTVADVVVLVGADFQP